jgi:aspartyl/asparaginyl beta-hydroxylase (cupin superfamily)
MSAIVSAAARAPARASRPWFAEGGTPFHGDEPFFFDPAAFAWTAAVEAQWQTIRDELLALIATDEGSLAPYANLEMTSRPNRWKTFGIMFWTLRKQAHVRKAPKTWAILKDIPGLCAVSFNLLEPNTTIKPHHGDTNAIIRCHMGLEVPAGAPKCAFRVGTETRSWQEGRWLIFCDAHEHTAWNNTDKRRYILVIDVMRPEYEAQRLAVAARVLASIKREIYYQRHAWLGRWFGGRTGRAVVFSLLRAATWLPLRRGGA